MMSEIRRRVFISGLVQGVAFRAYTRQAAQHIGVTGWVRNLPDGRVEAVIEGQEPQVEQMINWCRKGSPASRVDHVEISDESPTNEFPDFDISFVRGTW